MSAVLDQQQDTWIGVREAAALLECSPYNIQKFALRGDIRYRMGALFRAVYSRSDVLDLVRRYPRRCDSISCDQPNAGATARASA
jgi:hypothetical protein